MNKLMLKVIFIITLISLISIVVLNKNEFFNKKKTIQAVCKDCNIILITMTNLRYDHMSSNGYFRPTTPNLDKLANQSLNFTNAFSHSSWTLPEAMSIYTGLYPFQHAVMNRYDGSFLSPKTPTIVEILKRAGYSTAIFTGGFDYSDAYGLTKRFDTYEQCQKDEELSDRVLKDPSIPELFGSFECTVPKAIDWLKANSNKKFFLHIQGFDAHCPFSQRGGLIYDPDYEGSIDFRYCFRTLRAVKPEVLNGESFWSVVSQRGEEETLLSERDIKHLIAIYDEAITYADKEIGNLADKIKALGLWDKTIIIFTSEHGDMFGEHDRIMRGGALHDTFYDEVLHIPLLIKYPDIAGKKIEGLIQQIDLAPTILKFLGLTADFKMEGKDLTPLILNNRQVNSEIFAGSIFTPNDMYPYFEKTQVAAIRDNNWKLIAKSIIAGESIKTKVELYDIVNDKGETKNLADAKDGILAKLKVKLQKWLKKTGAYPIK